MTLDPRTIEIIVDRKIKAITPDKFERLKDHFSGYACRPDKVGEYDVLVYTRGRRRRCITFRSITQKNPQP